MANAGGQLLESSLVSASSLMALQLLSRVFTFFLNQALFRLTTPSAFGAATIQFELILSTILFLSREGIRNALLRAPSRSSSKDATAKQSNLSSFPIFAGIPLALSTAFLYTRYAGQEIKLQPYFKSTIALYALAAVIELFSEPYYNLFVSNFAVVCRIYPSQTCQFIFSGPWLSFERVYEYALKVLGSLPNASRRSWFCCMIRGWEMAS